MKNIIVSIWASVALALTLGWNHGSLLALVIFLLTFFLQQTALKSENKLRDRTSSLLGGLFAIFLIMGNIQSLSERYHSYQLVVLLIFIFCGLYFLCKSSMVFIFEKLEKLELTDGKVLKERKVWKVFFFSFVALLLVWGLFFLKSFPGNVSEDSNTQLSQALGMIGYTNHHPMAHTMMIKFIYLTGAYIFGSANGGVAVYSIVQMMIMAATFAYFICTAYRYGAKRWFCVVVTLFFACASYHIEYSYTMWKDVLFGAFVLLFLLTMWEFTLLKDMKKGAYILRLILLFVSGMGFCLFRSNGYYAFILVVPTVFVFFWKKNKILVGICVGAFLLSTIIKGPIYSMYGVKPVDTIESLSIPAQQIARVIKDGKELDEEQKELLEHIVNVEKIPEIYQGWLSNPVKDLVRETDNQEYLQEHKGAYLGLWLELGVKYPYEYLKAFIDQTIGYWYPNTQYWIYADYIVDGNVIGTTKQTLLPEWMGKGLDGYLMLYKSVPLLGLFYSIGAAVWLMLILAGWCIVRKRWCELCVFIPMITIWATILLATPVYDEFRYIYALFTTLPFLLFISCGTQRNIEIKENE